MGEEEESKKTEFARIQPVKVQKSMTAEELEAHKRQLEQYYAGKKVDEIDDIIDQSKVNKPNKILVIVYAILILLFGFGIFFSYYLNNR